MSRLTDISSNPTMREYAQGAAQEAIQPVADFIAPPVEVSTMTGRFKIYDEKQRFSLPDTRRALGGRATELRFDVSDGNYNCEPHALDYPVDNLERLEERDLEDSLKEGANAVAEIAGLVHEKTVIFAALAAAGDGTGKTWDSSGDPIADLDTYIINVLKAARYGSLMGVGVLFGVNAWRIFKNHSKVTGKFVVGNSKRGNVAIPTEESAGALLIGTPEIRTSYMVYDEAAAGVTDSIQFLLDTSILVFARKMAPTRRDPSFMKTFRRAGQWMVPGSYIRDDGRAEVAKFDWSEDVQVTNSTAVGRLNISES